MTERQWRFCEVVVVGGLTLLAVWIGMITDWLGLAKRAKPQLLEVRDCFAWVDGGKESDQTVEFKLLVNNAGSKDCSIIGIDLVWPDGNIADLEGLRKSLPKTIPSGQAESLSIWGYCRPPKSLIGTIEREKIESPPEQTTLEGAIVIKFNTKHIIEKKITFTLLERLRRK